VHQIAWSADSRLLVSGSADSTLKVWSAYQVAQTNFNKNGGRGLLYDLPGHADAVYAVDWAPDGQRVVSGAKDKVLRM
jgi:ribosome assembly protein 4